MILDTSSGKKQALQGEYATVVATGTVYSPGTLFIGTTGNVTVDTAGGSQGITFKNLPSGSILPVQITKVSAATATDMVIIS